MLLLGRCHTDRSGYDGPWTFSPTVLTNDFFKLLVEEKWQWKKVRSRNLFSTLTLPNDRNEDEYCIWEVDSWLCFFFCAQWNGPAQYEDAKTKTLMMLPTDMALVKDKEFNKHVVRYAKDESVFFDEFSKVIEKLFELGVPFKDDQEKFTLSRKE